MLLAIVGALPPVIAYWAFLGRTPTITPEAAKDVLADPKATAVLVDVRTPEEFAEHHIEAARNWPYEQIMALTSAEDVPGELRGKRLLLICESGILSSLATQHLRQHGVLDVENVQGGMQIWVAGAEKPCTLGLCQIRAKSGAVESLPSRPSSPLEQWIAVLTGFCRQAVLYGPCLGARRALVAAVRARPDGAALGHDLFLRRRELLRGQLSGLRRSVRVVRVPAQLRHGALLRPDDLRALGRHRPAAAEAERPRRRAAPRWASANAASSTPTCLADCVGYSNSSSRR